MAFYRQVWLTFWTDPKIDDEFTPEDKYFYLYLLTNPHTNICGCYEVGMRQMSRETGYNDETIKRLLDRMKHVHGVIDYNLDNKEIYILNWYKYNWNNSGDTLNGIFKNAEQIKTDLFRESIFETIETLKNGGLSFKEGRKNKTPLRPPYDPHKASVTVTDNNTVTDSYSLSIKEIIDYLNLKCNKKYTYTNKSFNRLITARLKEGHTIEDFKTVIDKKYFQWHDNEFAQYLKPSTLFAPSHFEEYLNEESNYKKKAANYTEAVNNRFDVVKSWMESTGGMDGE